LLEALRLLRTEGDPLAAAFRVRFVGQVTTKFFESGFDLAGEISRRGLSDVVTVAGHSPYGETLQAMLAAGILLLVDSPGRKMGVPAKLYEYLGAGRPILALAEDDGDVAWVLRRSGAIHRLARPNDVAAIRRALSELMPLASDKQAGAQSGCRRHEFSREGIARRLADAMRASLEQAPNRV
jgi:glycosyltransferase involved in cell wall biosynthesis